MAQTTQSARKRLLSALDIRAIHRLSERLNPEWANRKGLEAEISAAWPARKVRDEIDNLLWKASK
jgi:hypothetical protein